MKMPNRIFLPIIVILIIFSACKKDEPTTHLENVKNNTWIYNSMKHDYLFYKDIPSMSKLDLNQDPEQFFPLLLSTQEKRSGYTFSYIEKNLTTKSTTTSDVELSYGMEYARYDLSGWPYPFAIRVIYVIPNSVAAKAGVKRGDWFYGVNGVNFTSENVTTLLSGSAITLNKFKLTPVNGYYTQVVDASVSLPAATMISDNPVFLDSVYTMNDNTKIGYFVYNKFSTGPAGFVDKTYDNQMKSVFARFKSKGIQRLILDLRYNKGGYLSCCQLLSSMIVPTNALGDVMAYEEFNDIIAGERTASGSSAKGVISFLAASDVSTTNLNLNGLTVICSSWTASASELLVNALNPYLTNKVTLVGDTTVGKNMGSYEIKNDTYTMHPITIKIYNSQSASNYASGFAPDVLINELNSGSEFYPLGDTRELMLNKTLNKMGYVMATRSAQIPSPSLRISGSSLDRKHNELIIVPKK